MASYTTVKITDTLDWLKAFITQRPSVMVAQIPNEPALTCANRTIQSILAPPFKWSWNRAENSSIVCTPGQTDYQVALPNWGWLEKAYIYLAGNNPDTVEIAVTQVLAKESKTNQPTQIAPVFDDNQGNITFRLLPAPDQAYQVTLEYQQGAPVATTLGSTTWAPIPDRYGFLYEAGLLAQLQGMYSAQLYLAGMEMFFRQLVGAAEGLTDTEKSIFLEDQLRIIRTGQSSTLGTSQGRQARL
jgi:hypothetical protein